MSCEGGPQLEGADVRVSSVDMSSEGRLQLEGADVKFLGEQGAYIEVGPRAKVSHYA